MVSSRGRQAWALVAGVGVGALVGFLLAATAWAGKDQQPLRLSVDASGKTVRAKLTPAVEPIRLKVFLNEERIDDAFGYTPPRGRTVALGRDEGVRFGENKLVARGLYPDGDVIRVVRRFRVRGAQPLVGALDGGRVKTGVWTPLRSEVRLRGSAKRAPLKYRWRIVRAPKGSEAKLKRAKTRRPRLRPDAHGVFRISLTVRARAGGSSGVGVPASGAAARDVTQINVQDGQATRAGVFIGTTPLDADGTPTAIQIFDGANAGTYPIGEQGGPITSLIFDRCTLELLGKVQTGAGVDGWATLLGPLSVQNAEVAQSGCTLLVVTAGANYGQAGGFANYLNMVTGHQVLGSNSTQPFWSVWIPSPSNPFGSAGNAWTNYPWFDGTTQAGRMAGELVQDGSGSYTFRPSTVPAFGPGNAQLDFAMDESGISVPPPDATENVLTKFPSQTPGCPAFGEGGFQLLVLGASGDQSLEVIDIGTAQGPDGQLGNGDTFWTNGCTQAEGEAYAEALANVVLQVGAQQNDYPTVVFLQGVGEAFPPPADQTTDWNEWMQTTGVQIDAFGGSGEAFADNPAAQSGPGYSFVGQSWPLEDGARVSTEVTSSAPNSPPAALVGSLRRDRMWRLAPAVGAPSTTALGTEQLRTLGELTRASGFVDPSNGYKPEPFLNAADPEWQAAMHYAAGPEVLAIRYDASDACYTPPEIENGYGDVRSLYCGGGESTDCAYWTGAPQDVLRGTPYAPGNGFDEETWNAVVTQLAGRTGVYPGEFAMVDKLNCTVQSLQSVYGTAEITGLVNVEDIVDALNAKLKVQEAAAIWADGSEIVASFSNMVAAALGLAEDDDNPQIGTASGIAWAIEGVIDFGLSVDTALSGESALGPLPRNTTVDTVATQLTDQWQAASVAMGLPRDQIASDWNRLQRFDQSGLSFQQADITAAETEFQLGTYHQVWKDLIKSKFSPVHLGSSERYNPAPVAVENWLCMGPGGDPVTPFQFFSGNDYTHLLAPTTTNNTLGVEAFALAYTYISDSDTFTAQPVPAGVLSEIFAPVEDPIAQPAPDPIVSGRVTPLGISKQLFYSDVLRTAEAQNRVLQLGNPTRNLCPTH